MQRQEERRERQMSRQSTYDPQKAKSIIEQLSDGVPLRVICRQEGMPAWRTVYDWIARDEELAAHIARARELGYDAIAEECLDIADEVSGDYTETDKGMVYNAEHVQRSKLKIETRLKLLAKWNPKKYGERLDLGNAGGQPLKIELVKEFVEK